MTDQGELAAVYVNNTRLTLQGDPKPQVSRIIVQYGQRPDRVRVYRLDSQQDQNGHPLELDDFVDRRSEPLPVFLRIAERPA